MKLKKFNITKIKVVNVLSASTIIFCFVIVAFIFLRKGQYVDVVVRVTDYNITTYGPYVEGSPWFASLIPIGAARYDFFGNKIIEVIDKRVYPSGERNRIIDLTLRLKAVFDKKSKQFLYEGTPLLIGSGQKFNLSSLQIRGFLRSVGEENETKYQVYRVRGFLSPLFHNSSLYGWSNIGFSGTPNTTGIPSYLAQAIHVGDSVTDNRGEKIVTILRVDTRPSTFILVGSNTYSVLDQKSTDVDMEIELKSEIQDDRSLYLGIYPLLVNFSAPLYFRDYSITLTITGFERVESQKSDL